LAGAARPAPLDAIFDHEPTTDLVDALLVAVPAKNRSRQFRFGLPGFLPDEANDHSPDVRHRSVSPYMPILVARGTVDNNLDEQDKQKLVQGNIKFSASQTLSGADFGIIP
jgi:hypothetical protein